MTILSKYLTKEFFKLFILFEFVFLLIYLMIDFIDNVDNFVEANAPSELMVAFLALKVPLIITQMAPVATLIAVIVGFCIMDRNNEMIALQAGGVSLSRISLPVITCSFVIAIMMFLLAELVVPNTSTKSYHIRHVEIKKILRGRAYGITNVWYRSKNAIYYIRHFSPDQNKITDVSLYFFGPEFRLEKRIDAKEGIWSKGRWHLKEGIIQNLREDGRYVMSRFDSLELHLPERPDSFRKRAKKPEEMGYWQLQTYAARVKAEGYDPTEYLVDMNLKLSFPFINVLMALIGIPLALGLKRGGTPLAVSAGIGVCFLYMVALGLTRSLALAGVIPPFLAAWLTNFIFLFIGIYMMIHLAS